MPKSNLRRIVLAALLVVLPCAASAGRQVNSPPDLPMSDVLRLTEEAPWLDWETKLGSGSRQMEAAGPISVEAESLHAYDARHYRLDVTLSRTANLISGTMTLDLRVVDPAITNVDLFDTGLNVTATRVNGAGRGFTASNGMLLIPICQGIDCPAHGVGDSLQVAVDYSASPPAGFYYYPRNSYTFSEPYDARYWFPCYDLPNDKATLDVYATAPDTNVCVSNGVLLSVTPGAPGTKVYHWQETHPLATYLVAITVGNFWQWTQTTPSGPPIPILQNVFPEDSTKAKFDFANIPTMIPTFAARFGPYAFDKYGQVAVTPFGAGGMEHQSLTTINRSWVRGDRTAEDGMSHELTHQWWGDKVTCVDFRNIWLNEGFASYGECVWQESFYGQTAYDNYVQAQMNSALNSDNNLRYAIYDPPEANLFGNTIYKKGSLVLHMLRRILGDGPFFSGMQLYGGRFAYGTASTADFEQAMEDASGQVLDWYFNEWVYDKGLPTYNWAWLTNPGNPGQTNVSVYVHQVQTNAPFFRMPIEFQVQRSARPDTFVTVTNQALAEEYLDFAVNGTVTNVFFDPHNSIYKRIQQVTVGVPPVLPNLGPSVALTIAPNPASGSSVLTVHLGAPTSVPIQVRLYDSAGRWIRTLGPGTPGATDAEFRWDLRDAAGRRVSPGMYFAQARVGDNHEEKSIVVVQ